MKSSEINLSKLSLLPVPAGHKIRYSYMWRDKKGNIITKAPDGKWMCQGSRYWGPRYLRACIATLSKQNGEFVFQAASVCNKKDTPIKKLGRYIAHNRCIKQFQKSQQPTSSFTGDTITTIDSIIAADQNAA